MPCEIITLTDKSANFYVVKNEGGFFMIDNGLSFSRGLLKKTLEENGCKPGSLKLAIVTHGDYDHTGNSKFLRKKYGAKIAIHKNDAVAAETGNMLSIRRNRVGGLLRFMMKLGQALMAHRFKPDILLSDGDDLSPYGFHAKVVHTPGHTAGSISILTQDGDLFCGDFLVGGRSPRINSLVDDMEEMKNSIIKIKSLDIRKIYPGHGRPFTLQEFLKNVE